MKTMTIRIAVFIAGFWLAGSPCRGQDINYLDKLTDLIPQTKVEDIPKDSINQIKTKGDIFTSEGVVTIVGDATSTKLKGWFNSEVKNVQFLVGVAYLEEVLDVDKANGIVKARLTVVRSEAHLIGGAHAGLVIKNYDTKPIVKWVADSAKNYAQQASSFAKKAILSKFPPILWGPVGKVWDNLENTAAEKLRESGYNVLEDGTIVLSQEQLQKHLPDLRNVVGVARKTENISGVELETVWQWGKGYTSIRRLSEIGDEDAVSAFVKSIYRSSYLSAGLLFPVHKKAINPGDKWDVDASALGGALLRGFKYDYLKGSVRLEYLGPRKLEGCLDEEKNHPPGTNVIAVAELRIDTDAAHPINRVQGCVKNPLDSSEDIAFTFKPTGSIKITNDSRFPSRYVREMKLNGVIDSYMDKYLDSLMKGVKITGNAKIEGRFSQGRSQAMTPNE